MLSIIIFTALVLATYILNLCLFLGELSFIYITIAMFLSIVVEVAISALMAIIICKMLPDKWFGHNVKFFNVSKSECKFYVKFLKIKKWKDKALELGQLNGFKKDKIEEGASSEYLKKFVVECNSGFVEHLLSIIIGSFVIFFYPPIIRWSMGLPTIIINFIINYMSVAILRYNIPRLQTAIKFAERKEKLGKNNQ